jgi:penicillin-binding protein 1A
MSTKPKSQKPEGPTKRRRFFARMLVGLIYWGLVATIWGAVLGGSVVAYYAYDLPDVDDAFTATRRPAITILAADGSELATVGDLYGAAVTLQDLPPALPQAVLATEDRRFYSHFGLDVIGVARAMWVNVQAGRIRQGGSTITQQVAKNLFLAPDRTIKRKVQELLLALWLESKFTKDEIFTVYLNRVYLGRGTWGVDAAAKKYFGRPAARLSTWQAAVIAGLRAGRGSAG